MRKLLLVFMMGFGFGLKAKAAVNDIRDGYNGPSEWSSFQRFMTERKEDDQVRGVSYMVSGALATLGGVAGFYNSDESFVRGMYAIAQSVGVAAIGYGANKYWNGNGYNSFYYAVEGAPLTESQKIDLLKRFLESEKDQRQRTRWIKVATYSLIAIANMYSASHEEDRNVQGLLHFLAGTNAVIAVSYAF